MTDKWTHLQMIEQLERIPLDEDKKDRVDELSQISMADSLLMLADLDHEKEYNICRAIAKHLLGEVPEPDDDDLIET